MEYKKFFELANKGESQFLDYKIECNAFIRGREKDTAELIKDIIAFSNNGNTTSYIIIGISDNQNGFKSVSNDQLTDDNLQVLVKDNIFPVPKIKLTRYRWNKATDIRHANITFAIIQIGPQTRQCFRFIKDHINYDNRYCFKKNEVWIRRQAISDMASPEEIKRLSEGKEPILVDKQNSNVEYLRLSRLDSQKAIEQDLRRFVEGEKGKYIVDKGTDKVIWHEIQLTIENRKVNLVVIYRDKCTEKFQVTRICRSVVPLHHGVLLITTGNVSASALEGTPIRIKESWGNFCLNFQTIMKLNIMHLLTTTREMLSFDENETFCLAISKVVDTNTLFSKLHLAINCLIEKDDIKSHINNIHSKINHALSLWLEAGCIKETGKRYYEKDAAVVFQNYVTKELKKGEFVDRSLYGDIIFVKDEDMCKKIKGFLNGY